MRGQFTCFNCFNCGKQGHIAKNCQAPKKETQGTNPPVRTKKVEKSKAKVNLSIKLFDCSAVSDLEWAKENMKKAQREVMRLEKEQMNMGAKFTSNELDQSDDCFVCNKYNDKYGDLNKLYGNQGDFGNEES